MATCLWTNPAVDLWKPIPTSCNARVSAASDRQLTLRYDILLHRKITSVICCSQSSVTSGEAPTQHDGTLTSGHTAVLEALSVINQRLDSISSQLAGQDIKISDALKHLGVVEKTTEDNKREVLELTELVSELRDGVCRPEIEVEETEEEDEGAWSKDEYLAKYRLLAQIKADEVIEDAQIVARQLLGDLVRVAVNTGKIPLPAGVELMQAGLVAMGEDLETVHLVVDSFPDLKKREDGEFAIGIDDIHTAVVRATNLRTVLGGTQVLAVLLGQSIHPDAAAEAESKGIHVILRNQNDESAVF